MRLPSALRIAADWVLPPELERVLKRSLERVSARSMLRNRELKDRHAGQRRCFVIGNGPSLKGMDLKPLVNEFTISANSFYKHPDAAALDLKYLCIGDAHFMINEPRAVEWHRIIEQRMPHTTLILHAQARALIAEHGLYRNHECFFVEGSAAPAKRASELDFDLSRPLNVGFTTGTLIMIPLAIYLGFKEIYLLGFDANWLENLDRSYHFYDSHEQFPEFDAVSTDGRGNSYENEVESVRREFESHRLLSIRSRELGIRIWNATVGGRVDTYPRIRLEDVLSPRGR